MPREIQTQGLTPIYDAQTKRIKFHDYFSLMAHFNIDSTRSKRYDTDIPEDQRISLFSQKLSDLQRQNEQDIFTSLCDDVMVSYRLLMQVLYDPDGLLSLIKDTLDKLTFDETNNANFIMSRMVYLSIVQALPDLFRDLGPDYSKFILVELQILRLNDVSKHPELYVAAIQCILLSIRHLDGAIPDTLWRTMLSYASSMDRMLWPGLAEIPAYFVRVHSREDGFLSNFIPSINGVLESTMSNMTLLLACRRIDGTLYSRSDALLSTYFEIPRQDTEHWLIELVTFFAEAELAQEALTEAIILQTRHALSLLTSKDQVSSVQEALLFVSMFYAIKFTASGVSILYYMIKEKLNLFDKQICLIILCFLALSTVLHNDREHDLMTAFFRNFSSDLCIYETFYFLLSMVQDYSRHHKRDIFINAFTTLYVSTLSLNHSPYIHLYLYSEGICEKPPQDCVARISQTLERDITSTSVEGGPICAVLANIYLHNLFDRSHVHMMQVILKHLDPLYLDMLLAGKITQKPAVCITSGALITLTLSILIQIGEYSLDSLLTLLESIVNTEYDSLLDAVAVQLAKVPKKDLYQALLKHKLVLIMLTSPNGVLRRSMLKIISSLSQFSAGFNIIGQYSKLFPLTNVFEAQSLIADLQKLLSGFLKVIALKTDQESASMLSILSAATCGLLYMRFAPVAEGCVSFLQLLAESYPAEVAAVFECYLWKRIFDIEKYDLTSTTFEMVHDSTMDTEYPYPYTMGEVEMDERVYRSDNKFRAKLMTVERDRMLFRLNLLLDKATVRSTSLLACKTVMKLLLSVDVIKYTGINMILPVESLKLVTLFAEKAVWTPHFPNIFSDDCLRDLVTVYARRVELGTSEDEYEGSGIQTRTMDLITKLLCPFAERFTEDLREKLLRAIKIAFSTASLEFMTPNCVILYYFLTKAPYIHVLGRLANLQTFTDQLLSLRFSSNEAIEQLYSFDKRGFDELNELCIKKLSRKQQYERNYGGISLINIAHRAEFMGIALYLMAGKVVRTGRSFNYISGVANAAVGGRSVGSDDSRRRTIFSFSEQNMTLDERNRMYGILIAPIFTKLFNDIEIADTEADIINFLLHKLDLSDSLALIHRVPCAHGNMIRGFCNSFIMMLPYMSNANMAVAYLHIVLILGSFWFFNAQLHTDMAEWYEQSLNRYREDAIARNEARKYPEQGTDVGTAEISLIRDTILQTLKAFITYCFEGESAEHRLRSSFGLAERQNTLHFFRSIYTLVVDFYSHDTTQLCQSSLLGIYTVLAKCPFLAERYLKWDYVFVDNILAHLRPRIRQDLGVLRVFSILVNTFLDEHEQPAHYSEYSALLKRLPDIKRSFTQKILHCLRARLSSKFFGEFIIGYTLPERLVSSLFRESLASLHILLLCDPDSKNFNINDPVVEELCEIFHYSLNTDNQTIISNTIKFYEFVAPLCAHDLLLPLIIRNKLVHARVLFTNLYKKYGTIEAINAMEHPIDECGTRSGLSSVTYAEIYTLLYKLGVPNYESRLDAIKGLASHFYHSKMAVGMALHFLTEGTDLERSTASVILRIFTLQPPGEESPQMEAWKTGHALVLNYIHAYISQGAQVDARKRKGRSELLLFLQVLAGYGVNQEIIYNIKDMFINSELELLIQDSHKTDVHPIYISSQSITRLKTLIRPDYFCLYQLTDFLQLANMSEKLRVDAFKNVFTFLCNTVLGQLIMSNYFGCRSDYNIITNILLPISLTEYLHPNCAEDFSNLFLNFLGKCGLYLDWSRYRLALIYLLSQLNHSSNENKLLCALNAFLNNFRFNTAVQIKNPRVSNDLDEDTDVSNYTDSELSETVHAHINTDPQMVLDETAPQVGASSEHMMLLHTNQYIPQNSKDNEAERADKEFERAVTGMRAAQHIKKGELVVMPTIQLHDTSDVTNTIDARKLLTESLAMYSSDQVLSQLSRVFIPRVQKSIGTNLGSGEIRYLLTTTLSKLIAKLPWEQRQRRLDSLVIFILRNLSSTEKDMRASCRQCLVHIAILLGPQNLGSILFSVRTHCAKEFIGIHLATYIFYDILEHVLMIPHQTLQAIIQNPSIILAMPYSAIVEAKASYVPEAITQNSLRQIVAVVVRDMFSAQAQEQKATSSLRTKHIEVGESHALDIIRLTAASLAFSSVNQVVSFIEPLFRGCAYSFSSKQQDDIINSLLAGWRKNSTIMEDVLLEFIHYMMSPICFYHALIPKIIDACNTIAKNEKLDNARVEEDDLRRARAITDIRNEHMLLEPSPKRLYRGISSISGGFSGVGSSYDTTVPYKLVSALLQHGIEHSYGDPYIHAYRPYFSAIVQRTEECVAELTSMTKNAPSSLSLPQKRPPTISVEHYPEIADYVLLMLSSRAASCRAHAFHCLAAMMPSYPVVRTKLIASECCKALYKTTDKREFEACFRLINTIMTNDYDLFELDDYSLITKVAALILHRNKDVLLAYRMLGMIVKKGIDISEVYETMEHLCKTIAMTEGKEQIDCAVDVLSCFIISYNMTAKKRIVFIRNLLKIAAEFENNAGRCIAFACLKRVYQGIDVETLSGCVDLSVVSFIIAVNNCLQLKEDTKQTIKEAMESFILFIKRCEELGSQRCPLHLIRVILSNEKRLSQQTNVLVLLSCLAEAILDAVEEDSIDEEVAEAEVAALTILLSVITEAQESIFAKMTDLHESADFSAASFRLFASALRLLSLAPEFADNYNTLLSHLKDFFREDTHHRTLVSSPPDVRSRGFMVCNLILIQEQDSALDKSAHSVLLPFTYLISDYIQAIGDPLLLLLDRHQSAQILGDLLWAISLSDNNIENYQIRNAFKLLDAVLLDVPAAHFDLKVSLIGAVLCYFSKFKPDNSALLYLLIECFLQTLLRLRHYHKIEMDPRYESEQEFEERNPDVIHEKQVCSLVDSTLKKMEQIMSNTSLFVQLLESAEKELSTEKLEMPERHFRRPLKKNSVLEAMLKVSYSLDSRN